MDERATGADRAEAGETRETSLNGTTCGGG